MSDPYEITAHSKECPFCEGTAWTVAKDQHGGWIYECERCEDPCYGMWPKAMTEKYPFTRDPEMGDGPPASCGASEFGVLSMPVRFNEKGKKVI